MRSSKLVPALIVACLSTGSCLASAGPAVQSLLEFRQQNVAIQEWDLSCGAAALTTLLRYQHGLDISEKQVALAMINREEYIENPELLKIRQGFSLLDLKLFTDSTGLTGNGFGGLEFDNLLDMAPVLVPVNLEGYNHFVIFRGVAGKRVLLADPAWGNRVLTKDKFLDAWFEIGRLGKVGFTVSARQPEDNPVVHALTPKSMDFVMIQ